jgi:hypothetical protein
VLGATCRPFAIRVEPQRRNWLQRLIGETPMATLTRAAVLTAVIAVAALIGFQISNLTRNLGPSPSQSEAPSSPPATVSPSASLPPGCAIHQQTSPH